MLSAKLIIRVTTSTATNLFSDIFTFTSKSKLITKFTFIVIPSSHALKFDNH